MRILGTCTKGSISYNSCFRSRCLFSRFRLQIRLIEIKSKLIQVNEKTAKNFVLFEVSSAMADRGLVLQIQITLL